jgi:hypothetical protein
VATASQRPRRGRRGIVMLVAYLVWRGYEMFLA